MLQELDINDSVINIFEKAENDLKDIFKDINKLEIL